MANELLKVNYESETPTVSARELHEFLEIGTEFAKWISRMIDYGFTENQDYIVIAKNDDNPLGGRPATDYQLTVDMGKEIAMVQRSDKGKQARTYFINLEKAWNNPEQVMARALQIANKKIEEMKSANSILVLQIETNKPFVEFADTVIKTCDNILVRQMAKLLCDQHITIGEKQLYRLLREKNVIMQNNEPYQRYVTSGYIVVDEFIYTTPFGKNAKKRALITLKGQIWLVSKVKEWTSNKV